MVPCVPSSSHGVPVYMSWTSAWTPPTRALVLWPAASSVLWQCESADEVPRRSAPRLSRHMHFARSGWGLCVPPPRAQWVREAPATSVVGAFTGPPGSRRLRFLPTTPQGLGSSPPAGTEAGLLSSVEVPAWQCATSVVGTSSCSVMLRRLRSPPTVAQGLVPVVTEEGLLSSVEVPDWQCERLLVRPT
jgi:hypothetical protein